MQLNQWAKRHNVPDYAMDELRNIMGTSGQLISPTDVTTEATATKYRRLKAAETGGVLWRNNVGQVDPHSYKGQFIRYGLANDSKQMNSVIKSSDLIGITPVIITSEHVGCTIGQFTAREMKKPGWQFSNSPRERAQSSFLQLVIAKGGDACFSTGSD